MSIDTTVVYAADLDDHETSTSAHAALFDAIEGGVHPGLAEHLLLGLLGGVHDHDGTYSSDTHTHDYSPSTHTHAGGGFAPLSVSMGGYLVLTNVTTSYDGTAQSKGLGNALVDFTGASQAQFRVSVNKVGTGTQSWQLWNATDSAQIAVIDDAGLVGDKTLTATTTVVPSGTKLVRVRAKSSIAADDPVYYGGTVLLT